MPISQNPSSRTVAQARGWGADSDFVEACHLADEWVGKNTSVIIYLVEKARTRSGPKWTKVALFRDLSGQKGGRLGT
jgi:hypothetical protein